MLKNKVMHTLINFKEMKINGFFWILNKAKGIWDKESKNNIEEVILNNS